MFFFSPFSSHALVLFCCCIISSLLFFDGIEDIRGKMTRKERMTKAERMTRRERKPNAATSMSSILMLPLQELHICFVDPAYHRKGIGSQMLKWGCELADLLSLPAWVEASPDGNHLYKVFGFENVVVSNGEGDDLHGTTMKRPASVSSK